jgi:hypothetical protein
MTPGLSRLIVAHASSRTSNTPARTSAGLLGARLRKMSAPNASRYIFRPFQSPQARYSNLSFVTPVRTCRRYAAPTTRPFSSSVVKYEQQQSEGSFRSRLRTALRKTKIEWYTIPAGVGIGFLGLVQFYRIREREKNIDDDGTSTGSGGSQGGSEEKPQKRKRIRPTGPWQVQIMSTLPLKAMSRIWGKFNELEIPYYLRVPGFKLYGWVFGVK